MSRVHIIGVLSLKSRACFSEGTHYLLHTTITKWFKETSDFVPFLRDLASCCMLLHVFAAFDYVSQTNEKIFVIQEGSVSLINMK